MKALNGKKVATGFQTKIGFIPELEILGIVDGQVQVSDEIFAMLMAKKPIPAKRMKLEDIVDGIKELEGNSGKKWNPITKSYN